MKFYSSCLMTCVWNVENWSLLKKLYENVIKILINSFTSSSLVVNPRGFSEFANPFELYLLSFLISFKSLTNLDFKYILLNGGQINIYNQNNYLDCAFPCSNLLAESFGFLNFFFAGSSNKSGFNVVPIVFKEYQDSKLSTKNYDNIFINRT